MSGTALPPRRTPRVDLTTPVIIGHRGMGVSHHHPANPYAENTRASFRAAHAAGARWVELDVLPSADGDLMVHHDHFLTALGADPRPIWEIATEELLHLGVEPLDGLCADLPANLGLYLELKVVPGDTHARYGPPSLKPLTDWIGAHASHRPLLAATFDPYAALDLHASGIPTGLITDQRAWLHTTITAVARAGLDAVIVHGATLDAPSHELTQALAMADDHAIALWCWYPTIDRIPHYRTLGVTGFCVDDVAAAVTALHGHDPR